MTHGAACADGSVLAFTEYLRDQGVPVVWAYREDRSQVPAWASAVRAGTARHRWLAARSRWWLTDGLPMRVSSPDTVGRPLERGVDTQVVAFVEPSVERVGSDVVDWPLYSSRRQQLEQIRGEADVDLVVAPARGIGEQQARALGFTAPMVVSSVAPDRIPDRASARATLGIDAGASVVGVISVRGQEGLLCSWLSSMDDITVLAAGDRHRAEDIVGACDVLLTDVSGWAAVAARLGRPVIIGAGDLRDLLSRGAGLYLPWQRDLPGPWVHDAASFGAALRSLRIAGWSVPAEHARGHAALAELAGASGDASCADLLALLESTP